MIKKYGALFALLLVIVVTLKIYDVKMYAKNNAHRDARGALALQEAVAKYHRKAHFPIDVNRDIELADMRSSQGILYYDFHLKNIASTDITKSKKDGFYKYFIAKLRQFCKKYNAGDADGFEKFNFDIQYNLLGSDGQHIFSISKPTEEC